MSLKAGDSFPQDVTFSYVLPPEKLPCCTLFFSLPPLPLPSRLVLSLLQFLPFHLVVDRLVY